MFFGEYSHNIDEKGRLSIPAKLRSQLKGGAVVTKGLDNCLFLYPKKEWQSLASKMAARPLNKANERALARHFLAGAMEVDFDSQGRINLPEYLRDFAGLRKKAVVAGVYDRLEIWNETAWNNYKMANEKETNNIAEALEGIA